MASNRIDIIEQAYHKAGFRTVHREDGAISFAKKAPVVVITRKSSPISDKKRSVADRAKVNGARQ
jgi:hypothetical protein